MTPTATIPNGWTEETLEEVIDLIIDHRGKTPKKLGGDWADSGYRAISAKTVKNGQLVNEEHMNFLPENLYKKWMKNEVQYGDVFLTSEAPLGEHLIWKSEEKLVLSQRIFGIRANREKLDSFYFNYFIDSPFFQHELKSRESGSTVAGIRQVELMKTKVLCPSLPEQKAIAAVLSSLDDKIELLREQNKTLEKTAQTIFKEWFEKYGVDDELPEGWKVGKLGDILELSYGKALKTEDRIEGIFPVYGSNGIVGFHNEYLVKGHGIVVGRKGTMGSITWCDKNFFPIDTAFYVEDKLGIRDLYFHYFILKKQDFKKIGSDSAVPGLNRNLAHSLDIVIPTQEAIQKFSKLVKSIFEKMNNNSEQIETLSNLRDTLLPELMKGEVRVKNLILK